PQTLALGVRATVARARGQLSDGLSFLERPIRDTPSFRIWDSPVFSRPQDRFLRAELLDAQGRGEEALAWFASIERNSLYDLASVGPALLRRGQIAAKLGRGAEAAKDYQRLLDLWSDADPALDPLKAQAKAALTRLKK